MESKKTSDTTQRSMPSYGSWSEGYGALSTASSLPDIGNSYSANYCSDGSEDADESNTQSILNSISRKLYTEEIYESFGPLGLLIWNQVETMPKFKEIVSADELLLVLLEYWLEGVNQPKGPHNSLSTIVCNLPSKQTLQNFIEVESSKEAALYMLLIGVKHEFNLRYQEGDSKTDMQPLIDRFLTSTPNEFLTEASQLLGLYSISS